MKFFKMNRLNILALCAVLFLVTACKSPEEKAQDFIQSGHTLFAEGNYGKSIIEYKNALQIDDTLVEAWYGVALAEQQRKKWQQVIGSLRRTLDLQPDHFDAAVLLGRLYLVADRVDLAIEHSNNALKLRENDVRALSLQAGVLYKLGNSEGAYDLAKKAVEQDPTNMDALIVLAAERLAAGEGEEAIGYLDQGIQVDRENVGLQLIKIQALSQLKRPDEAENVLKKLIELNPESLSLRRGLVGFYLQNNKLVEAEKELRILANEQPNDVPAQMQVVQFINQTKGSSAAIGELQNLIQARSNNYEYKKALYNLQYASGEVEDAISLFKKLSEEESNSENKLDATLRLAEVYISSGKREEAIKIVEEVLTTDTRNSRALAIRGAYHIENENLDAAIQDLRAILVDEPESVKALVLLGNAFVASRSLELADERYGQAFRASNSSNEVGLLYANFLVNRNFMNRAEDILVKVIQENNSADQQVYEFLTRVRMTSGDWLGAQEVLDIMKRKFNEDTEVQHLQGQIYAGQNKIEESINTLKSVHRDTPLAAQPMISLVQTFLQSGQTEEAITFINSVLEANDKNFFAYLIKARLQILSEDPAGAESSYRRAIEIDPDNTLGYSNLSLFFATQDKRPMSIEVLNEGISKINDSILLRLMRANAYEVNEDFKTAIQEYEEILSIDPGADIAINNLANLLLDHGQGQSDIDRAYGLVKNFERSEVPHFKDTLGLVYLKKGEGENAIRHFKAAVRISPDQDLFKYHLGKGYVSIGDNDTAVSLLTEILEKEVDNGTVDRSNVEELLQSIKPVSVN